MTQNKINNPQMTMPTIAGTRMPFLPCLETPNKATMPETKPTAMSKSANSTKNGMIFRATICRSNMKSAKMMRLMTGQIQPSVAARCENDFVFGDVGVSIFGCGLTKKAEPRGNGDNRQPATSRQTEGATRVGSGAVLGHESSILIKPSDKCLRRSFDKLPHLPAADKSARAVRRPNMSAAHLTENRTAANLRLPASSR